MTTDERLDAWSYAVMELARRRYITPPLYVAPGVWAATHTGHGWGQAAYTLATLLPGQLWNGRRSVSWVCGRPRTGEAPVRCRLIDVDDRLKIREAQDTLADLGIRDGWLWSVGACARAALSWVADPATVPSNTEILLEGIEVGYHDCAPGVYDPLTLFDVSAYYYNLAARLPSLRVEASRSGALHWQPMRPDESARWRDLLQAVEGCKVLRNSLVGCAMGARGKRKAWVGDPARPGRARQITLGLPGGPFRGAGLLVIRSAYELCNIASLQCSSVYSTIDSVATESALPPKVWVDLGLAVERKAAGLGVICRRGCWSVGPKQTLPYKAGYRLSVPVSRAETPQIQYWREWLQ